MSTKHQQQFAAASLAGSLSTVASSAATGNNYVPGIPQRTFPGQLNSNNRGSVDWGSHGLLAYGCQDLVVVVHVETLQVAQTFHGHTANVVVVRWSQSDDRCSFNRSRQPRLASGDIAGRVLLWSVQKTKPTSLLQLTTPQKGVLAIQFQPENEDVIAVLYAPSTLALWNIRNGQKICCAPCALFGDLTCLLLGVCTCGARTLQATSCCISFSTRSSTRPAACSRPTRSCL